MAIPSADEIKTARAALAAIDPALGVADAAVPPFAWRTHPGGFAGLSRMIVSQQVSTASANAIWTRLAAGLGAMTPQAALAFDEAALKSFGLSQQKARYVRAIAEAHMSGAADFDLIPGMNDAAAIAALTTIKGVGRWTAELYLLFAEVRMDAFPAGDLAIQEGLRLAEGAEARPTEKGLYARAEAWRPYRGVAAHLLWAYYSLSKRGQLATLEEKP